MRVGIYDLKYPSGKDLPVQQVYEKILAHNGIPSVRLRYEQPDFWEQVRRLSLFIMRFRQVDSDLQLARDLIPVIEQTCEVNCFPNQATGWHYDDKIKQYHLLHSAGFPMTECYIFYDREAALSWVEQMPLPMVFKLRGGAGSRNVVLVTKRAQARRLVKRMFGKGIYSESLLSAGTLRLTHFNWRDELHRLGALAYRWGRGRDITPFWRVHKNYVLFQKFLPDNAWDTRITVIGERAFGFRRLVRKDDFRASGSGRIDYDTDQIDPRCVRTAFDVSRKMGFQCMSYDFLMNENQAPEFCEVSYTFLSSAVHNCPGYWDPAMNWHEGHFWPEHLHLIDALNLPDLEAPDLDYL
ncbi:MAG: RimK family alpha-L-glutamate ligase [Candidatus Hydrogenedentota bacterium]